MVRPMTAKIATVAGVVANDHQSVHHVSASPPAIPDGPVLTLAYALTAFPV